MSVPCIIIPSIVGIISGILGYLIGRMAWNESEGGKASTLKAELDACHSKTKHLSEKMETMEGELMVAKSRNSAASDASSNTLMTAVSPVLDHSKSDQSHGSFDSVKAKMVLGKKVVLDDLKLVEGIGPKIADLFLAAGIKTWKDLSEISIDSAQTILDEAGDRYTIHNPGTWSRQAKMMQEGKWEELKAWQETLDGGKE